MNAWGPPNPLRSTTGMERIGDDKAGFSIDFDHDSRTVNVRAWGFWNVEVATAFGTKVAYGCRTRPSGSALMLDMTDLKPMRDEGQLSFRTLLGELRSLGISRTTIKTENQLTKLQLRRLASQSDGGSSINFA